MTDTNGALVAQAQNVLLALRNNLPTLLGDELMELTNTCTDIADAAFTELTRRRRVLS